MKSEKCLNSTQNFDVTDSVKCGINSGFCTCTRFQPISTFGVCYVIIINTYSFLPLHHKHIFVTSCVLFYYVGTAVLHTLVAGLLARSRYPEGPAIGHLGTGFSWIPCVEKRMLRWFPRLQVATACFSCSPPNLSFLDPNFIFMYAHYNHCHRATAHLQLNVMLLLLRC